MTLLPKSRQLTEFWLISTGTCMSACPWLSLSICISTYTHPSKGTAVPFAVGEGYWRLVTGGGHRQPHSCNLFSFPYAFLCRQPTALCPACPQTKQWRQFLMFFCTQSWHLPLSASVIDLRTGGGGRFTLVTGSGGLTTRTKCWAIEVTCAGQFKNRLRLARLACNSKSTLVWLVWPVCLVWSVCSVWSVWAAFTDTGRVLLTVPRRLNQSFSSLDD